MPATDHLDIRGAVEVKVRVEEGAMVVLEHGSESLFARLAAVPDVLFHEAADPRKEEVRVSAGRLLTRHLAILNFLE